MPQGLFITFEGGEGVGKSTQMGHLADMLRAAGHKVCETREPGGSPGAEAVRHVILSGAAETFGPRMEALLFGAARADHLDQLIRPALQRGEVVLCDRFIYSSRVYQGVTGSLDPRFMRAVEETATTGIRPDLTLILDLDPAEGLRRASARRGEQTPDRFEKETLGVQQRRRDAFLAIARAEPERCRVVDASRAEAEIADAIADIVLVVLGDRLDALLDTAA